MPDDVKPDDPSDSAETLRIMADLERHADMHAPTLSDSADVMDEARHRLAVLQQACNAHPGLRNRVAALESENAKLRELLYLANTRGFGYHDDGELQDNRKHPHIDYKRDTVEQITEALRERALADPEVRSFFVNLAPKEPQ